MDSIVFQLDRRYCCAWVCDHKAKVFRQSVGRNLYDLTTVNRWSAMGVLNPVKMGHRVYYLREDVEKAAMEHGLLKKAKRRSKNED